MREKRKILLVWTVATTLIALDLGFTLYGMNLGILSEGNPIMLFYIEKGLLATFLFKSFKVFVIFATIFLLSEIPRFMYALMYFTVAAFGAVNLLHFYGFALYFF